MEIIWRHTDTPKTDEELDYPENSREKGKGRADKKPRMRKQIAEVSVLSTFSILLGTSKKWHYPALVVRCQATILCIGYL
mgnify:CR=1 FL=1|tara:strand:- start:1785 stop:2024 length:240 start_codon:yes stop_codon:yes gene_type:complete